VGVSSRVSAEVEQAVEAVFEAEHFEARVAAGLDDGADDRVEAGGVAAAGEHTDLLDIRHEAYET
jgi:hypothetical protein